MPKDLTDKIIAITGASSGIGKATALACAKAGMHVALNARGEDRLKQVADEIQTLGRETLIVPGNVDNDQDVQRFIDQTVQRFGRLDAVFANAGYGLCASIMETSDHQSRAIFETNFFGTLRIIHAAVPHLKAGGHVLICSSAVSEVALPMYGLYGATKAAQDSVAGALRAELRDQGIAVSSIHPITTDTQFFKVAEEKSTQDGRGFDRPPGMTHTPERVAKAIVKCLRKPRAEVWPAPGPRFGMAILTAFPGLSAMSMYKIYKKYFRKGDTTAANTA